MGDLAKSGMKNLPATVAPSHLSPQTPSPPANTRACYPIGNPTYGRAGGMA
jgi:hypothetical protein